MNVYVESNFVLEHALQQEECETCDEIIKLAASSRIWLVIPAFSLAEPYESLSRKEKMRSKFINELQAHLSELGRSKPYREVPANFSELAAVLIRSAEHEREGLQRTIAALLDTAELIPLDAGILRTASELQLELGMSGPDSIVFSSILAHLTQKRPARSCFLNRNTKDFDDPDVRDRLDRLGCKFFGRFDEGLRYVHHGIRGKES